MKPFARLPLVFAAALALHACASQQNAQKHAAGMSARAQGDEPIVGQEEAALTDAPKVPPPITRDHATKVIVNLEIREEVKDLAPGVQYNFWTFGGNVPGKFIRVRAGDLIEFHLHNHPGNKNPHNIDLHAVNGPGGGATASLIAPGRSATFTFRALNPGLYVYHCATAPVGMHVANGMYGLILVEPVGGLPKVDHEYYVMQGEFYTQGRNGEKGFQPFSMAKAIDEHAEYVVFNGSVGSLTEEKALRADVGETVRLFVGNGGPNLTSAFHVIGEIFDRVHVEAGALTNENVQTTLVPPGGATIVEFKINTSGNYILVDHALTRAFNKGALGILTAGGEPKPEFYSGKLAEGIYLPEGSRVRTADAQTVPPPALENHAQRVQAGERLYMQHCAACHQPDGRGIEHAFPPLAGSDFLNADVERAIRVVSHGFSGEITVNGKTFNSVMPSLELSPQDVSSVLTYVYNSWGNAGADITPAQVEKAAAKGPLNAPGGAH